MSVDPLNFLTLTEERINDIFVPPLKANKDREGYFSSQPKLDGKDIYIQTCILSAKGYGVSAPDPSRDIKSYSLDLSLNIPPSPPNGPDGNPDVSTYNTRNKIINYFGDAVSQANVPIDHQYFAMLYRLYGWFQNVVKERSVEFLGDDAPTQKELDEKVIHTVKFPMKTQKFGDALQYGPKFSPGIYHNMKKDAMGNDTVLHIDCKAYAPDGTEIPTESLVKRRFTCYVVYKVEKAWKMISTNRCGIKFQLVSIHVTQFFDQDVKVNVKPNMYGELPDDVMIAAAEAAEANYHIQNEEEMLEEAANLKRERTPEKEEEEEEEEEEPKKPTKKSKTSKKTK